MEIRKVKKKFVVPKRESLRQKLLVTTLAISVIPLIFFLLITKFSTPKWQDTAWIYSGAGSLILLLAVYGLAVTGIIGSIFYFTARRITAPLKRLEEGMDFIRNGDLDHRIEIDTNDEIGELAESFNQMTANLKKEIVSLKESEERYNDLIDNLSAMIHQIDKDMRFVSVNRTELRLLGYSQEEMLNMRLIDLVPEEEKEKIYAHIERLKKEGRSKIETVFIKKNGERINVEIDANAIYKENGAGSGREFLYTSAHVSYIDKRRGLERKLFDHAKELAGKESKDVNHQSVITDRMVPVDKIAAGIAHAINGHMGVISGFIQMMLKDCKHGCPGYEELKIVDKHINYTEDIIEDLLDFARVSRLEKEGVDINKSIEEAVSLLEHQLLLGDISVVRNLAGDLPKLFCDPKKLQHVYISILANAANAMKDGGTVTIFTGYSKYKRFIEIRFRDTGPGIPDEDIVKIFNPFYTLKGTGAGMSLSLPASYGIVKEHEGELLVESKEGEGTIFTVLLPIDQEDVAFLPENYLGRAKE